MDKKDIEMIRDMNKRINIIENTINDISQRVSELHQLLYKEKKEEFMKDSTIREYCDDEMDYCNR
jgi:hypothetical protein